MPTANLPNSTFLRTHHYLPHTCSHVRIRMMLVCVYILWLDMHVHTRPWLDSWSSLREQCRNLCLGPHTISSLLSTNRHGYAYPTEPWSWQRSSPSAQWQAVECLTVLGAKTKIKWVKVSSVCSYIRSNLALHPSLPTLSPCFFSPLWLSMKNRLQLIELPLEPSMQTLFRDNLIGTNVFLFERCYLKN